MAASSSQTLVSVIIPTLNAGSVLEPCLQSIRRQSIKSIEIIIADGGSSDTTLAIAKKYKAKIVFNPLKTAEAGKAIALKHIKGQFVALIDSDNILPSKDWLKTMLLPFSDPQIICSEPIRFTYRRQAGFIERYSALLGANDPYAWFNGVYDRYSYLSGRWTNLKINQIDKGKYLKIELKPNNQMPTIGANGTIFRTNFLQKNFSGDYLFDIDILASLPASVYITKVKIGIVHTYCEASISKFIRKQKRRIKDYYFYQKLRRYPWSAKNNNIPFALYSLLIIPALFDSLRGFIKKPDPAWFFHPLACLLTFLIYSQNYLLHYFGFTSTTNRHLWQQ